MWEKGVNEFGKFDLIGISIPCVLARYLVDWIMGLVILVVRIG